MKKFLQAVNSRRMKNTIFGPVFSEENQASFFNDFIHHVL